MSQLFGGGSGPAGNGYNNNYGRGTAPGGPNFNNNFHPVAPRPAPTGRNHPHGGGGRPNPSGGLGVRGRQHLLTALGYHIGGVDGIWGPLSRTAWRAHLNGIKPGQYNANHAPTGSTPPPASHNPPATHNPPAPGNHPGRGGGGGRGGNGGNGGGAAPALGMNPKKYARGLTNQMYAPILHQIRHQRGEARLQGAQDVADIQKWYGDAHDAALAGIKGNADFDQAQLAQNGEDQRAMADAILGGHSPAGGTAAAFAALMHGQLAGLQESQHGFDQGTATAIAAEGAQQGTDQHRLNAQQLSDINSALQGQLSAKAGAYQTNLGNAETQALQNEAAQQNMQIAQQQFGLQQAIGRQNLKQAVLSTKALRQQVGANANGINGKWTKLSSGDKATMLSGINSITYIKGPAGRYTPLKGLDPVKAWVKAGNYMRSLGWNPARNQKSRDWMTNWFRNYVQDYNQTAAGKKNPYTPKENGTPWKLWPGDPGYARVHNH